MDLVIHKKKFNVTVWSNLAFVMPLLLDFHGGLLFHSLIVVTATFFSTLYHIYDEKRFKAIDRIFAYSLILSNLWLCYLSRFQSPYFQIALAFVIIGLYFHFKALKEHYELNHSVWHVASALITSSCILGYITYL